jgi:hypothetical protein
MLAWDHDRVEVGADSDTRVPNNWTESTAQQLIAHPIYSTATLLLEDVGGSTIILRSPYSTTTSTIEHALGPFDIVQEGDTYYLWLGSRNQTGSGCNVASIEQRFESQDGLMWRNRANTNLVWNSTNCRYIWGLREVVKNGSLYEGWEEYYYEWTSGWALSIRYVTSADGLTWSVVNQPALIGAWSTSVAKVGSTYHMWETPHADSNYTGSRSLRYRTSTSGGTGWGHWQTGGTPVLVDGTEEVLRPNRVRRLADGTYQLFYIDGSRLSLATSVDGVNFTTQVAQILDVFQVLPISAIDEWVDFDVVDMGGEDWFYFTYCSTANPSSGLCVESRIAVSRPTYYVYLPLIARPSTAGFPVRIGDAIPVRPVVEQGEIFYTKSVPIPGSLPAGGRFYFSSQPDRVAEALVDDKLAVLLGGDEVFVYNFSTSGHPTPAVVEVPRPVAEQMAGKTVVVEYRDVYASVVEASQMWLIWVP